MVENNLIIGKWYNSSRWHNEGSSYRFMAKYSGVNKEGYFTYSECIGTSGYSLKAGMTDTDGRNWGTFSEITPEKLAEYLPIGHIDLQKVYEVW